MEWLQTLHEQAMGIWYSYVQLIWLLSFWLLLVWGLAGIIYFNPNKFPKTCRICARVYNAWNARFRKNERRGFYQAYRSWEDRTGKS